MTRERTTADIGLPAPGDVTENELAWIGFIRLIAEDRDPPPSLMAVQALSRALRQS